MTSPHASVSEFASRRTRRYPFVRGTFLASVEAVYLFLQDIGLQFLTYTNEKAAHVRLIIRGLGVESEPDEVGDEIRQLGFPIKECIPLFTTHGPRQKLPLLRVIVQKGELVDRLLGLTSLCG